MNKQEEKSNVARNNEMVEVIVVAAIRYTQDLSINPTENVSRKGSIDVFIELNGIRRMIMTMMIYINNN